MPHPHLAVLRVELARFRGARVEHRVVAVARGELDRVPVAARKPERRIRPLHGLDVELEVAVGEVLALVIQHPVAAGGEENVQRFAVALARLLDALHAEERRLDRRDAAPDAQLQAPAAHLVEHAHLVVETERVVPGQAESQRARGAGAWCAGSRRRAPAPASRRSKAACPGARRCARRKSPPCRRPRRLRACARRSRPRALPTIRSNRKCRTRGDFREMRRRTFFFSFSPALLSGIGRANDKGRPEPPLACGEIALASGTDSAARPPRCR